MNVNLSYLYQHMMSQLGGHGLIPPPHQRYPDTKHMQDMRKSVAELGQLKPYDMTPGHRYTGEDHADSQPQDLSVRYPPPPSLQYPPLFIKREPSPGVRTMSPPPPPHQLVPVKSEPDDPGYRLQELGHLYHGPDLVRSYSVPARDTSDHSDTEHGVARQMSLDRGQSAGDKRQTSSDRGGQDARTGARGEKEEGHSSRTIIGTLTYT